MRFSLLSSVAFLALSVGFVLGQDARNVDDLSTRDTLEFPTRDDHFERDLDIAHEHARRQLTEVYSRTLEHGDLLGRALDSLDEVYLQRRDVQTCIDECPRKNQIFQACLHACRVRGEEFGGI